MFTITAWKLSAPLNIYLESIHSLMCRNKEFLDLMFHNNVPQSQTSPEETLQKKKKDEISMCKSSPKTSGKFFLPSLLSLHPFHSNFAHKYWKEQHSRAPVRALSRQDDSSKPFTNQPFCSTWTSANDIKHKKGRNFSGFPKRVKNDPQNETEISEGSSSMC